MKAPVTGVTSLMDPAANLVGNHSWPTNGQNFYLIIGHWGSIFAHKYKQKDAKEKLY